MKKAIMPSLAMLATLKSSAPDGLLTMPRNDAGNLDKMLGDLKQELERVGSDVKKTAEQALSEAKKHGEVSEEAKASADKLLNQFSKLSEAQKTVEQKLEELETKNLDLAQQVAGGGGASGDVSFGAEVANSEELKAFLNSGANSLTLQPKAAITSADGSAGGLIWEQQEGAPVNMPMQALPLRALLEVRKTSQALVTYPKQVLRNNQAAPTGEGVPLPESEYGWEKGEAPVRKIGHHTNVSDEALADAGELQGLIDGELRYGLRLEEEEQILAGDGSGENLIGLITDASGFAAAAGLPNETRIDRLRLGMLQVALADYAANGLTMHPTDWTAIDLQKDTQNRYLYGDPGSQLFPMLWGLPVVPTKSHGVGEWMAGNFFMAATLYDRQEVEVLISSEHGNNFIEGMKTIKATERVALAHKRDASLVTGDFVFD